MTTAPVVDMPAGLDYVTRLTPEGVARYARVTHAAAPHGWRVAGMTVWSGATGEYCTREGGSSTIGNARSPYELEGSARRSSRRLSDWREIGEGVSIATSLERDWSLAP